MCVCGGGWGGLGGGGLSYLSPFHDFVHLIFLFRSCDASDWKTFCLWGVLYFKYVTESKCLSNMCT